MTLIVSNLRRLLAHSAALTALAVTASTLAAAPGNRELQIVPGLAAPARSAVSKPAERSLYLLAYFKDATHSLHLATSADGYTFSDVNDGKPVLSGMDIAEQHGIRDPYITRGPDGAFYLAMTDLHIAAKAAGLRPTEWERPFEKYGWGNNRSLIFMKSFDLIHWTHSIVHVDELFSSTKDIGTAWAPEVIFDPVAKKMMVYYTTRHGNGTLHMVYSYADKAFTTLTTEPKVLFTYPKAGVASLDGDITKVGDKYHLFYAINEAPGQIRHAVSRHPNAGFLYEPAKINPETVDTEAPTVWRRFKTDTYVLMYDVFGAKPVGNMGFSETTDFVHFRDLGHFNDKGSPMKATNFSEAKHGAVIAVSKDEVQALHKYFGSKN